MRLRNAVATGVLLTACQTLHEVPTQPDGNSPTQGVVSGPTAPGPLPGNAPSPGATPTPAPTPGPTPAPTPQPSPPSSSSCSLPRGSGSGQNCQHTSPSFLRDVENGIDDLIARHPEYFDLGSSKGDGVFLVKNLPAYHDGVIRYLEGKGLCATFDGEEVAVKNTNAFNDQYDIITSTGFIRRGEGAYESTCSPAWF